MRILFFGDSITESHKSLHNPLGNGFVKMLEDKLRHPVINKGVSGNTSRDLCHRLEKDVLNQEISEVYMMIGINDVWQHVTCPSLDLVDEKEFQENIKFIIKQIQNKGIKLHVVSPFYLNLDPKDPMVHKTASYQAILRMLAHENRLDYIDVQKEMNAYLRDASADTLSVDYVHVNQKGNQIIADVIENHAKNKA